jgi:WD40 repeat protein
VNLTPDGKFAISGFISSEICIWELKTGSEIQKLREGYWGGTLKLSPDGIQAIIGTSSHFVFWNLNGDPTKQADIKYNASISSIAVSPNGEYAITSHRNGTCNVWNVKTEKMGGTIIKHNIQSLSITPDNYLGIAGHNNGNCNIWNLRTGHVVHNLTGHISFVNSIAVTPDGLKLISGSVDRTSNVWDLITGQKIQTLEGTNQIINAIAISPDGQLAMIGSNYGDCSVWNLKTFQKKYILQGHIDDIWAVAISPDGKLAVSGSSDRTCILWDIKTGKRITSFKGHNYSVKALAFTPDGNYLISGSEDKTCILWDIVRKNQLARFVSSSVIDCIALSSRKILLGCRDGNLIFLDLNRNLLHSCKSISRIVQIYDFEKKKHTAPICDCPLCNYRFEPPLLIIRTILRILKDTCLTDDQSPCLELPDEAWEHPGLIGECPSCHEKIKFNPFFGSDPKGIQDYCDLKEFDFKYQKMLDDAEKAFKEKNWEDAYRLFIKLLQQGRFDPDYLRFNIAICSINGMKISDQAIISDVEFLIKLLSDNGAKEKSEEIASKLKEKIDLLNQEESERKKNEKKPWWKKLI